MLIICHQIIKTIYKIFADIILQFLNNFSSSHFYSKGWLEHLETGRMKQFILKETQLNY